MLLSEVIVVLTSIFPLSVIVVYAVCALGIWLKVVTVDATEKVEFRLLLGRINSVVL